MTTTVATIAEKIRAGGTVSVDFTLSEFCALYNQLQGSDEWKHVPWVVVLLGHQAIAEPLGARKVKVYLRAPAGQYFTATDFAFVSVPRSEIVGSTEGQYTFRKFLHDIVQPSGLRVFGLLAVLLGLLSYEYIPWAAQSAVATALLSALSIFVTIFVLFILSVDPEKEYGYLRNGRFRKLAETDKHIAMIGVVALFLAVGDVGFLAAFSGKVAEWARVIGAVISGTTVDLAFASFWLVIQYHFSRKHEMTESRMAAAYLASIQKGYEPVRPAVGGPAHLRLAGPAAGGGANEESKT